MAPKHVHRLVAAFVALCGIGLTSAQTKPGDKAPLEAGKGGPMAGPLKPLDKTKPQPKPESRTSEGEIDHRTAQGGLPDVCKLNPSLPACKQSKNDLPL